MASIYALLQPDGTLLTARPKGSGWAISNSRNGIDTRGRNLIVFLSGLDVLGLSMAIPARSEKEARRAAPFAVEDELAETVEESHVALSVPNKSDPSAPRQINVISNTALKNTIQALADQGLQEAEIVAAHSVLPSIDMLYAAPGLVLGRLAGRSFAIDPSLGQDVLIGMTDAYSDVSIHGDQIAKALRRTPDGAGAASLEALLVQLCLWAEDGDRMIRLRQGAFEARRPVDLQGIGRWKFPGILAAIAALGWFSSVILETNGMHARTQGLNDLTDEFARVGWPELGGDAQQVLALSRNSNVDLSQPFIGLLDSSALLYAALEQVDGSELRTIRYDRVRRQMTASISFQSFADVDRLTNLLNSDVITARSGDARQSGNRVIGDLTLERAS